MRLNRYLSVSGYISRRKGEEIIRAGEVKVNGAVVTDPAHNVDPERDMVTVDGRPLLVEPERRYLLLNKPVGYIVSVGDPHGRPTVLNLIGPDAGRVFPVGRLDSNTSGVLLLTDDGELAYRLTHPSYGVEKVYRVVVRGRLTIGSVRRVASGIELEDGMTAPAGMTVLEAGETVSTAELTLHEGRKRQVRRMMEALGHTVIALERISFGGLTAKGLRPGAYRDLHSKEIAHLRRLTDSPTGAVKPEKAETVRPEKTGTVKPEKTGAIKPEKTAAVKPGKKRGGA